MKEGTTMRVLGYSERGLVNALFHEIRYSTEPESLLQDLLARVRFPFAEVSAFSVSDAEVLIEQSFSDFGTADALLLFGSGEKATSVFFEAKVGPRWSVAKEFQDFKEGVKAQDVSSSNLFTQLYHKVRLMAGLQPGDISAVEKGLDFPESSSKRKRKIGSNDVVRCAVRKLVRHKGEVYYVALLPDKPEELMRFFESASPESLTPDGSHKEEVCNYGYLSWRDARRFCNERDLGDTRDVFAFNKGQIYPED
jgi:hypothetical protein